MEDETTYDDAFEKYRKDIKGGEDDYFSKYKDPNIKLKGLMQNVANTTTTGLLGTNTGYGDSKYDKNLNWYADVDPNDIQSSINENRAQNQGWGIKAGAGVGRVAGKVVAEVAKMPGFIGGAIAAPFAEEGEGWNTMVNNSWIKSISQMNEDFNAEVLPVYVKKAVTEGNLWDNISSIDFWATEGADGIGYIASMMVPGAALKALGVGNKLSKLSQSLGKYAISAQKADVITATVANTLFEAGAEAGNAMEGFQKDMDRKLQSGEISMEEYDAMNVQKARLGRDIFLANSVILLGPNALQANMLWGKGLSKSASKMLDSEGKLLKTIVEPKLYQKVLNRGKDVLTAGASEGLFEEAGQMTVENMFTDSAHKGQLGKNPFKDFNISELGNAYLDTVTSTEGQKAMFLGAFLGGGMQSYQGAKTDQASRKETQSLLDTGGNAIDAFYKTMQTDSYNEDGTPNTSKVKEKLESFGTIEQLNIMYNDAVQKQDKEALDKLRDLAATQLAYGFIMNEELGLDVLKQHLEASSQFDEIVQREQDAGNKTTKKDIIDNVMSKAKTLEKSYRNFNDFAPTLVNPNLKEGQTAEDVQSFTNTLRGNYISNKANIKLNEETLKKLKEQKNNVSEDLELDPLNDEMNQGITSTDERLISVNKDIEETQTNLDRLKKLDRNFWNKDHLQKAFNRSTKEKKQLEEAASEEAVTEYQDVLDVIISHDTMDGLKDYVSKLDSNMKSNPTILEALTNKGRELKQQEDLEAQMRELEAESQDQQTFAEDADFGTTTTPTTTTTATDVTTSIGITTLQSSETAEVDSENNIVEENPLNIVNLTENTNPENSEKNQGAARVISTYQETGEAITGLEKFVKFEKIPRDKTKDKVTFSLGDVESGSQNKETKLILDKLKQDETLTEKEITALKNYLPIKVTLTNENTSKKTKIISSEVVEKGNRKGQTRTTTQTNSIEDIEGVTISVTTYETKVGDTAVTLGGLSMTVREFKEQFPMDEDWGDVLEGIDDDSKITVRKIKRAPESSRFESVVSIMHPDLGKMDIGFIKDDKQYKDEMNNSKLESASSFLDSMSHPNPDIVARETLPLRKAIVASLIENKGDFEGIGGSVEKQFSGKLKLGEQSSNVLELDVFKGMTEKEKITYFKKNTVYVSNKGVVKYAATDAIDDTKSLKSSNKGEVFLRIPMINGEMFYLKLNSERLTQDKASAVFQLIKLRSNILNKKEELDSDQLQDYITANGLESIQTEFDFIKRNSDSIDQTIERLINFVVYAQNTNAKTKLILGQDGKLVLGELLHKVNAQIPEWSGQLESYVYTNETLNTLSPEQEQAIIEYLKYKRHNVLITKDDNATFNNEDYLKYMLGLNSDYPILTTNAVVNEPTFQGYSNIYLNQSVTNKSVKKEVASEKVKEVTPKSDVEIATLENNTETKVEKIIEPTVSSESTFKKATEDQQLEMLEQALLATNKTLDDITSDNLELEFNKLIEELRKNNKISEINKICGK